MRFRSEQTVIRYAGAVVLGIGQRFGQDEFARTQEYTTQAVQVLGAAAPVLDSYGNAQGSTDFSVAIDFATPEEALAEAMRRQGHVDGHQTGVLELQVGDAVQVWNAGILRFESRVTFPGNGVRLLCSYAFVTA